MQTAPATLRADMPVRSYKEGMILACHTGWLYCRYGFDTIPLKGNPLLVYEMATANQIKSLIKCHLLNEDEQFLTIALQVAASKACFADCRISCHSLKTYL